MNREFISTSEFERRWNKLGLGDKEQRNLEKMLLENPKVGAVIPGTGSARKIRVEYAGKGKRGGARVIYVDLLVYEKVFFITAYAKGEQENISETDKKAIANFIEYLKDELEQKRRSEKHGKRKK